MIKVICIVLYLVIGLALFNAAVREIGGKEVYMEHLSSASHLRSELAYYICGTIVTVFWPWFIIFSIIQKEDEE